MPKPASRVASAVVVTALFCVAAASAADLRFETLVPAPEGFTATVVGSRVAEKLDELSILADGADAPFSPIGESADRDRVTLRIEAPTDVGELTLARRERRGLEPEAAVVVGADRAPFGDWTVYHVMLGYFRNGYPANDGAVEGWRHANWAGGDLQGVREKAGYLADLGIDAVWLSPLFRSPSSHGYDVLSYYVPGDQFAVPGDVEASKQLLRDVVRTLDEHGIATVIDIPLNHAHRAYDEETGDPRGRNPRKTGPRQEAEKTWASWGAPFGYWNLDHEPTRRFLFDAALHQLDEVSARGLRLDYARGADPEFWAELYATVKAKHPDAWLLGEVWKDGDGAAANAEEIARYYAPVDGEPQFDSLVDFPMQIIATDVFARGGSLEQVEEWLQEMEVLYADGAAPAFFLDNHDTTRFLSWTDEDERLVAAVTFLATLSNPLIVFYGTETGLANAGPEPGFLDAGRIPMPWDDLDTELTAKIRAALQARAKHPALTAGGRLPIFVDDEVLVMAKVHPSGLALVGVNLGDEPRVVEIPDLGIAGNGVEGNGVAGNGIASYEALVGDSVPVAAPSEEAKEGEEASRSTWTLPPLRTSVVAASKASGSPPSR